MKKIILIVFTLLFCTALMAQGNKGNKNKSKNKPDAGQVDTHGNQDKDKEKDKDKLKQEEHDRKVWDGVSGAGNCTKPSKNQPAKVRSSFLRDYPNAANVRWTKCRGDWTATFASGLFYSTAVYHANGERRDTRTPVSRNDLPGVVLDSVFKKRPGINIGDVIRIELPGGLDEIFRIKSTVESSPGFLFMNKIGELVNYDY